MYQYMLGTFWQESSFAEKDLRVLVDKELIMCQQCALAAREASSILDFTRKIIASRPRHVIFPRFTPGVSLVLPTLRKIQSHGASPVKGH